MDGLFANEAPLSLSNADLVFTRPKHGVQIGLVYNKHLDLDFVIYERYICNDDTIELNTTADYCTCSSRLLSLCSIEH